MKHFKYNFIGLVNKKVYRQRVKQLSKKERRHHFARKFLLILNLLVFISLALSLIFLLVYITTIKTLGNCLKLFLKLLVGANIVLLPSIICVLLHKVIDKFFPYVIIPQINKKIVDECTVPLKKYYGITDNFIITKCYKCSVNELTNKDLLLFVHNENLRIVNNFTSTIKDFGCYEFSKNEFEYCYKNENGLLSTYITCNEFELLLGKRAKPFIERNVFKTLK